jgi:hypothetical protein
LYPILSSREVAIRWLIPDDELYAVNSMDNSFNMFDNGTTLDGNLVITPSGVKGGGIINTTDSRVTSNTYSFSSNSITADSCDYNFKSPSTRGNAFIAEDTQMEINFDLMETRFHLNTDTSMVKFPEIQYICTMTDFTYNQGQDSFNGKAGKIGSELLTREELLSQDPDSWRKPTSTQPTLLTTPFPSHRPGQATLLTRNILKLRILTIYIC